MASIELSSTKLIDDIKILIAESKRNASVAVNVSLTAMYWHIGRRINQEVLQGVLMTV